MPDLRAQADAGSMPNGGSKQEIGGARNSPALRDGFGCLDWLVAGGDFMKVLVARAILNITSSAVVFLVVATAIVVVVATTVMVYNEPRILAYIAIFACAIYCFVTVFEWALRNAGQDGEEKEDEQ